MRANGLSKKGTVEGSVSPQGGVEIFYVETAFRAVYAGQGDAEDGFSGRFASGKRSDGVDWSMEVTCGAAAPAAPAPPAAGDNSREVTGDVGVYDVPGGVGTVIGVLQGGEGQRVRLGSGCKEDRWCNIVWPEGAGGTACMWGDFPK